MFPLVATPALRVVLVGQGPMAVRRAAQLREAGLVVEEMEILADESLLAEAHMVFIVDVPEEQIESLVLLARKYKVWVNVHDQPSLCDFYIPSMMRQGDLLVSVSTSGKAPGLAKRIRQHVERLLGTGWNERIQQLQQVRDEWKQSDVPYREMVERMDAIIDREGWL